jgi:glycosyltransferase involved in cell wall biosynthesis
MNERKIRILILSYYFPPTGGGGVQRILKLIKYLPSDKYQILVISSRDPGLDARDPSFLIDFPAHVKVIRIDDFPPHRIVHKLSTNTKEKHTTKETSRWKRWLGAFLFVPDTRKKWASNVVRYCSAREERFKGKFDLILASMPPYSTGIAAKRLSEMLGIPYILDFRDGWRYHPFQIFPTPIHSFWHKRLEHKAIRHAEIAIFSNHALQKKMESDYPNETSIQNSVVIYNGYDPENFNAIRKNEPASEERILNVGLPGTVYFTATRPYTLISSLKNITSNNRILFHLMGKWTGEFEKMLKKERVEPFFRFHGYLNHQDYISLLLKMDACFMFLEDVRDIHFVIPGRFFELVFSRVPLFVFGPENHEIQTIIQTYKIPVNYLPNSEDEVRNVLVKFPEFIQKLKAFIEDYDYSVLHKEFSRPHQIIKWENVFRRCLKK